MWLYSSNLRVSHSVGLVRIAKRFRFSRSIVNLGFYSLERSCCRQLHESTLQRHGCSFRHNVVRPRSMDEGAFGISPLDDWGSSEGNIDHMSFSSDGEDSDGEILVTPINDVDMPKVKKQFIAAEDALTVTAQRLAMLGRRRKKYRIRYGFVTNLGLFIFLTLLLALVDWCAWRIVRLPLDPFHVMSPFLASGFLVACAGYVSVPLLKTFNICTKIKKKPYAHYSKRGTPTIGGLFFVPIGVAVARYMTGSTTEVSGVAAVTLACAAVGLLDDTISLIKNHDFGLAGRTRFLLEVAVAAWFSYWMDTTDISSPYSMKMLVPLPAPVGLMNLGKYYLLLTPCSFLFMENGVNITDGLDGLAGGTAALAFAGMSIAVLPISSELSVFGASMAGACAGFLLHNRHKASVFMGNTGSFALGGALAAMASCSGMFLPLCIASGIFFLEVLYLIVQVLYLKITERLHGKRDRLFRVAPLHHHLELCGIREPFIVAGAYFISSALAIFAGYVGLVSA